MMSIAALAKKHNTPGWLLAAATVEFGWLSNRQIPEQTYLDGVRAVLNGSVN